MIGPADIEAWRDDAEAAAAAESQAADASIGAAPRDRDRPRRRLVARTVAQGYAEIAALRRLFGRWS